VVAAAGAAGVALPPRIILPDTRLILPRARELLRRPRIWRPTRTAEDALTAAASVDVTVGTKAQASSATVTLTPAAAVASGALIVIGVGFFAPSGATASITTAAGLTWANTTQQVSGSLHAYQFYALAPSGLASGIGSNITWTISGAAAADWLVGGMSFTGMETTPTLLAQNGAGATAQAWSSGSLVAGETNVGVVVAFEDGSGTGTSTATAPLTERIDFNSAGQSEAFTLAYNLASASTATLAGQWNASQTHVTKGAAYKIAAATAQAPPFPSRIVRHALLRR
jgi:hypothetical protein